MLQAGCSAVYVSWLAQALHAADRAWPLQAYLQLQPPNRALLDDKRQLQVVECIDTQLYIFKFALSCSQQHPTQRHNTTQDNPLLACGSVGSEMLYRKLIRPQ